MKRFFILSFCFVALSGCRATNPMARLYQVREHKLHILQQEVRAAHFEPGAPLYIRIFKEEAALEAWLQNRNTGKFDLYKTYHICSWSGGLGPKLREGDHQSPEGFYEVTEEWMWPGSRYHLAMNIGFPNEFDQHHGLTGSALMIHGGCKSEGCYAMTDPMIEEIYLLADQSLQTGQRAVPVHIFPFRMTAENMQRHTGAKWMSFWRNLKQGYDLFESSRIPPRPTVKNGRYVFRPQVFKYAGDV